MIIAEVAENELIVAGSGDCPGTIRPAGTREGTVRFDDEHAGLDGQFDLVPGFIPISASICFGMMMPEKFPIFLITLRIDISPIRARLG